MSNIDNNDENIASTEANVEPKKVEEIKKEIPDYKPAAAASNTPETKTIIQKRGGVGFMTATFLSCCAALGGAYLALFIQARPDIAQTLKITPFLPKSQNLAELDKLQKDIADLQKSVAAVSQPMVNVTAPAAAPAQPSIAPNAAQPAQTADANAPKVPLQNTQVPQAQVQAAQQAITLEPLRADIAGLSGRLTAIETRLAALDPTGTGGAIIASLQTEIATLKVTVANLQQQVAQTPSPATTFAIMSLAEAAGRNGSFMPEFEAVRSALPYLPEVSALEPLAKTGAPTRGLLREEFMDLSAEVNKAQQQAQKQEKGLTGFFHNLFANAFKVEVKQNNQNNPSEILARAKTKLDLDDLQGAIAELQTLPNAPQSVGKWIEEAKRRQDLEVKISTLRAAIERNMYAQIQQPQLQQQNANAQAPIGTIAPPPANNNAMVNGQNANQGAAGK